MEHPCAYHLQRVVPYHPRRPVSVHRLYLYNKLFDSAQRMLMRADYSAPEMSISSEEEIREFHCVRPNDSAVSPRFRLESSRRSAAVSRQGTCWHFMYVNGGFRFTHANLKLPASWAGGEMTHCENFYVLVLAQVLVKTNEANIPQMRTCHWK